MLPIPEAMAEGLPAMSKRLKAPPHPDFKFIRGRRGRDVIRIKLPSGGVGFIATTISRKALAAFAASLSSKIAKRTVMTSSEQCSRLMTMRRVDVVS